MSTTKKKLAELMKSHKKTKITLAILIVAEAILLGLFIYYTVKAIMRTTEKQIPAETYGDEE